MRPKRSSSTPQGSTATRSGDTAQRGIRSARSRDAAPATSTVRRPARVMARERGWARSVPCSVTARARPWAASAGHSDSPKWAWTTSNRSPRWRRRSWAAPSIHARAPPAENENTSRSTSPLRRRACTWSWTKLPSPGLAGVGYMLVTISARMARRLYFVLPTTNAAGAARSGSMGGVSARADLPVAVFDSGVGGLTVLHELLVSLPSEDYLYLGDTARLPYGNRTREELQEFAMEIADHLISAGAKLVVVACNSASAAALDALDAHLRPRQIDVIGVVKPAV